MTTNKANIQAYYDKISEGLACIPEKRQQVLTDLKESVKDYLLDHPNASIEEIHESFGSPDMIIEDNMINVPVTEVVKSKRIKKVIIIGVVAVIAVVAIFMIIGFIDGWRSNRGKLVDGSVFSVISSQMMAIVEQGGIL